MSLRLKFDILTGEFERQMEAMMLPIAETATRTMDEVLKIVKSEGRSDIARAGFSKKWQNTLRVDRFPRGKKVSVNAAVYLYHRIEYAGVFEEGARISGRPLLWVRLSDAPKRLGRKRMTPRNFVGSVGPLTSMTSRNGTPILGAPIRLSRTQAVKDRPKITLAGLRRGKTGKGILRTVPLFAGIRVANVKKQLNITEICEQARNRIPALYAANFRDNG